MRRNNVKDVEQMILIGRKKKPRGQLSAVSIGFFDEVGRVSCNLGGKLICFYGFSLRILEPVRSKVAISVSLVTVKRGKTIGESPG